MDWLENDEQELVHESIFWTMKVQLSVRPDPPSDERRQFSFTYSSPASISSARPMLQCIDYLREYRYRPSRDDDGKSEDDEGDDSFSLMKPEIRVKHQELGEQP